VTGKTFPSLSNPDDVFVNGIPGHNVAEAARHVACAFFQYADHVVAPPLDNGELGDQSIHNPTIYTVGSQLLDILAASAPIRHMHQSLLLMRRMRSGQRSRHDRGSGRP